MAMNRPEEGSVSGRNAEPFIRLVEYHMDSCAGTNKSQFVYGGLGLIVATGKLDCIHVLYMVVGHTKFGPDLVARAIAGKYNSEDTLNHAMLNKHIGNFATFAAYDATLLQSWRRATPMLFRSIDGIMSYRSFFILGDDGEVVLESTVLPADVEPYQGKGSYYYKSDILTQAKLLATRSLKQRVIPSVLDGTHEGVGEGYNIIDGGDKGRRLLPKEVKKVFRVRLFVQKSETEDTCFEIHDWMHESSVSMVNKVLRIITGYSSIGEMDKIAYGAKKKQIEDQFYKFVDPRFVPDRFAVSVEDTECSPAPRTMVQTTLSAPRSKQDTQKGAESDEEGECVSKQDSNYSDLPKPRWKVAQHAPILIELLKKNFKSKAPVSGKDAKRLAALMPHNDDERPWDARTLKRHAKDLEVKRRLK